MTDPDAADDATLFPKTAGERLREAREAQGLSLAEIAARTRVPMRQLEAIENSDYAQIPSTTYAIGFARAYARVVGVDEVTVAREVRGVNDRAVHRTEYEAYEISEPARVPSRGVAIVAAAIALLVLIGIGLYFGTSWFRGEDNASPAPIAATVPDAVPSAGAAVVPPAGQVTLTATGDVWLRIYDATGKTLFENTLKAGDHYDVPGDANGPMINIGRPDELQITVNGSAVPPLGDGSHALKDVGISAAALSARAPSIGPAAAPVAKTSSPRSTVAPSSGVTVALPVATPTPRRTPAAARGSPSPNPPPLNIAAPAAPPAATGNSAP